MITEAFPFPNIFDILYNKIEATVSFLLRTFFNCRVTSSFDRHSTSFPTSCALLYTNVLADRKWEMMHFLHSFFWRQHERRPLKMNDRQFSRFPGKKARTNTSSTSENRKKNSLVFILASKILYFVAPGTIVASYIRAAGIRD